MSEFQVRLAKLGLSILWLFAAASFFMPAGSLVRTSGQVVFWFMLVAHAIECVVFWRLLKAAGKPMVGQVVQIVLFGVFHYQTIRKKPGAA